MRWGSLLLMVGLLGCERAGLRSVLGDVELDARALHFEPTFIGFPSEQALVLRNTSRMDRVLTVTSTGPFSAPGEVTVPGGAQVSLSVRFEPTQEGLAAGALSLVEQQNVFEIALDGEGKRPPTCSSATACRTQVFDPAAGACVEALAADGSSCAGDNACFVGGTCSSGLCLGTSRDCADSNRCTLDACDPAGGCVHLPVACTVPADPCKVARCDPAHGCVIEDAQDGTSCGPADCSTARVCMLGACKTLPVPDGASCGPATACQGSGTCRQQACERPAPGPLTEAWSYDFPGIVSGFRGVSDAAENLYWVECAFGGLAGQYCNACTMCAVTSYTRNGALRYRTLINGATGYEQEPLHLIAGPQLVYAMPYAVGAVAISDGSLLWERDFYGPLPNAPDVANVLAVTAMASDPTGVYLLARRYQNNASNFRQSVLLKLNPATGAVLYSRFYDGDLEGLVLDELNNLFIGLTPRMLVNPTPPQRFLLSLSSAGLERWRVLANAPVAAYSGEVIVEAAEVRSSLDGTMRAAAPGGSIVRNALMAPASRTLLRDPPTYCCPQCSCPPPWPSINAIGLKSGLPAVQWEKKVASSNGVANWAHVSDTVASRQTDLLVAGASGPTTSLVGLSGAGAERFTCEIPPTTLVDGPSASSSRFESPVALLNGRWAVVETIECRTCITNPSPRLRVFEVPGEAPALNGWTGGQGGPSGSSRPR